VPGVHSAPAVVALRVYVPRATRPRTIVAATLPVPLAAGLLFIKTPMTEGSTKHSAQIKIDLFPQMRAGWWGSWGKMGCVRFDPRQPQV
jgi:hypothetical protein